MAETTGISWADSTWSPWLGCTKISAACDHCYAEAWAKRSGIVKWGNAPRKRTGAAYWRKPVIWNREAEASGKRRSVFPSLCDPFDNQADGAWRLDWWDLIAATPHLDWLLLTKRPQNIWSMLPRDWQDNGPWTNVWLGTTVENQEEANRRIPQLLSVPAVVRFLSCEPLLGPVDLRHIQAPRYVPEDHEIDWKFDALTTGDYYEFQSGEYWSSGDGPQREGQIDWVITGGESGPHARPMHPDWARSLRDQCVAAGVPFFFKQWGEWAPIAQWGAGLSADKSRIEIAIDRCGARIPDDRDPDDVGGQRLANTGKKAAGALLDGRLWREMPATKEIDDGNEE